LNSKNQRVDAAQAADVIEFTFKKDGKDYGKAWANIDDSKKVIIYFDDEQSDSPSDATPGVDYDDTWTGFLKYVKNWSSRRQLGFELKNKDLQTKLVDPDNRIENQLSRFRRKIECPLG
jgi:hypothetical protein